MEKLSRSCQAAILHDVPWIISVMELNDIPVAVRQEKNPIPENYKAALLFAFESESKETPKLRIWGIEFGFNSLNSRRLKREKTADTFGDATTGWSLRNDCRNSILMTCH